MTDAKANFIGPLRRADLAAAFRPHALNGNASTFRLNDDAVVIDAHDSARFPFAIHFARIINLNPTALQRCPSTRLWVGATNKIVDIARGPRPIDLRILLFAPAFIGSRRLVLRSARRITVAKGIDDIERLREASVIT